MEIRRKHNFVELELFYLFGIRADFWVAMVTTKKTRLIRFRSESFIVAYKYKFNSYFYTTVPIPPITAETQPRCELCTPF